VVTTARPPSSPPLIVAHRGGAPGDVENSRAAFEHAITIGADLIECDLRRTSDNVIVLYHDERIDGLKVRSQTFSELRKSMPEIMTLDDLLMLVASQRAPVRVVLDLKERGLELSLIPVLEQRPDIVQRVLVSTVHTRSLRRLAQRFPGLRLALSRGHLIGAFPHPALRRLVASALRHIYPLWMIPQLRWSKAGAAAMQHLLLTPPVIARFHRLGIRVYAWTVDDLPTAEALAAAGVEMIASNQPWELLGLLGRRD
jgi:glycerophosphoryl diester phosphodiesterase